MILPDKLYTFLKWMAIVALPALATLVKVVCSIWNLPYGDQIATTITAIATFIGALLMVSTISYNKKNKVE